MNHKIEINTLTDFIDALEVLQHDPSFPKENIKTGQFIEAMKAWLYDNERNGYLANNFEEPYDKHISWRDLYKLIQAAAIYE